MDPCIGMGLVPTGTFPIPEQVGRKGGTIHRYAVKTPAKFFEGKGRKVTVEHGLGENESIDLVVDGKIAIEVETGESDIKAKADKLRRVCFLKKAIVCLTDKSRRIAAECSSGDILICKFEDIGNAHVLYTTQ